MAELDYEYLDRLLKKAKEDDSDALAELYAATYRKQYRYACQYIEDPFLAQDILQDVYICAFENIESLDDSRCLVSWLEEINGRICMRLPCRIMFPRNHAGPGFQIWSRRLQENCSIMFLPDVIWNLPQSLWRFLNLGRIIKSLDLDGRSCRLYIPDTSSASAFLFLKPSIVAERKNVDSASNALYDIRIQSLLPVRSVSATLDNSTPVPLRKSGFKKYTAEIIPMGS